MAHFSVWQRSPFKNNFMPSRRHCRQTGPMYLAIRFQTFLQKVQFTAEVVGGRWWEKQTQPIATYSITSRLRPAYYSVAETRSLAADYSSHHPPPTSHHQRRRVVRRDAALAAYTRCAGSAYD